MTFGSIPMAARATETASAFGDPEVLTITLIQVRSASEARRYSSTVSGSLSASVRALPAIPMTVKLAGSPSSSTVPIENGFPRGSSSGQTFRARDSLTTTAP